MVNVLLGLIGGDIIGSPYEKHNITTESFEPITEYSHITDDTITSCAIADAYLAQDSYERKLKEWYSYYPHVGYGTRFRKWAHGNITAQNSKGNGAAVRACALGVLSQSNYQEEAIRSALPTHNTEEAIKGAVIMASVVHIAYHNISKDAIECMAKDNGYNLDISSLKHKADYTCEGTIPKAIKAFLETDNYISAVKRSISYGGDSDTIAAMTGAIAYAYYKHMPADLLVAISTRLDNHIRTFIGIGGENMG